MRQTKARSGTGALVVLTLAVVYLLTYGLPDVFIPEDWDERSVSLRVIRERKISYDTVNVLYTVDGATAISTSNDREWAWVLHNAGSKKITLSATQRTTGELRCEIWINGDRVHDNVTYGNGTVRCRHN